MKNKENNKKSSNSFGFFSSTSKKEKMNKKDKNINSSNKKKKKKKNKFDVITPSSTTQFIHKLFKGYNTTLNIFQINDDTFSVIFEYTEYFFCKSASPRTNEHI